MNNGTHIPAAMSLLLATMLSAALAELDVILRDIYPTTRFPAGANVGLFWEVYGLGVNEAPEFTVTVIRERAGASTARGNAARADTTMRVSWTGHPSDGSAIDGRKITLDLATLDPARYALALSVRLPDGSAASTSRRIEILRK